MSFIFIHILFKEIIFFLRRTLVFKSSNCWALTKHIFELAEEENLEKHYKISYGANDIFTIFESIKKNEKDFSFNSIYPNFKTSLRDFTDTKVYLNLKLPIKEFEAYL